MKSIALEMMAGVKLTLIAALEIAWGVEMDGDGSRDEDLLYTF